MSKKQALYHTEGEAQVALANKKNQHEWKISKTENGWWIVIKAVR